MYGHPVSERSPAGLHGSSPNTARYHAHVNTQGFYNWSKRRLPDPGVQNYSFNNHRVIEQPYTGDAVAFQKQFRSVQPPQLYVPNQGVYQTGLGGIQSGQIFFQPLSDPNASN